MTRHDQGPPRVHRRLLRRLLSGTLVGRTVLGDLEEEYRARVRVDGRNEADAWFRSQARRLCLRELGERLTTGSAWRRRLRSGTPESAGQRTGTLNGFATLWQDGRYAARSVAVHRGRSLAAIVMLAFAIGIATAMFTIVDAVILRPVPFSDPDQLAQLRMGARGSVPPAVFRAWRQSRAFEAVEATSLIISAYVGPPGGEIRKRMRRVTPGIFDLLGGVRPLHGRLFEPSEGRPGADDRVLISEDLWRTLYGADPSLVGRTIQVNGTPMVVVGILPSHFRFPGWATEIWKAASFEDHRPTVYVRFAAAMPRADALQIATAAAREASPYERGEQAKTSPVGERLDDYYARAVPLLLGGVVLLFFVLCANTAGLLLTGLTARAHELGTRTALGAPRGRLVRQAFLEATLLGAAGIAAGAGLGSSLVSILRSLLEAAGVHSLNTPNVDARALGVASIAGLVATIVVGVLPAVTGTRVDAGRLLQMAGGATSSGRSRPTTRALLLCQIALSCTLLFGATMLVRSFVNLVSEDRGLDLTNVLTADMVFPSESFATEEARAAAARAVEDAVRALPGVTAVSWSYGEPPQGATTQSGSWTSDLPGAQPVAMDVYQFVVDGAFFDLYRVPILRGRPFQASDGPTAVLVSERLARALWADQDPVGRSFTFDNGSQRVQLHVIGLVGDIRRPSIDSTIDSPQVYMQFSRFGVRAMLSFRCAAACPHPAQVRQRLMSAHPEVTDMEVVSPERRYTREFVRPRAAAALASVFAVTALIAAAAGLFSLFSQSVHRRRRELGIRTALGATPAHLRRHVWSEGLTVTLFGIALGAVVSYSLARVLSALLFDVAPTDPVSWAIVALTLATAIAAAAWYPTKNALRASPVTLLRVE